MSAELVAAYLTHLRAAGYSRRTIADRGRFLSQMDAGLPRGLAGATVAELTALMARRRWAAWTRFTYHEHLATFYRWALAAEMLPADPTSKMTRPRTPGVVPHPVTDAELEHALDRSTPRWPHKYPPDQRWRLAILLSAYAGLRVADILALRREDITEARIRIEHGKGDRAAEQPTHPMVWAAVESLPSGLVIPAWSGWPSGRLSAQARRHFDNIGMPKVHLHRFRHWYATTLLTSGADIRVVQTLMRHKSLATTAGYLQVADARRVAAVNLLPPMGGDAR